MGIRWHAERLAPCYNINKNSTGKLRERVLTVWDQACSYLYCFLPGMQVRTIYTVHKCCLLAGPILLYEVLVYCSTRYTAIYYSAGHLSTYTSRKPGPGWISYVRMSVFYRFNVK